jgi:hypothetical protein
MLDITIIWFDTIFWYADFSIGLRLWYSIGFRLMLKKVS